MKRVRSGRADKNRPVDFSNVRDDHGTRGTRAAFRGPEAMAFSLSYMIVRSSAWGGRAPGLGMGEAVPGAHVPRHAVDVGGHHLARRRLGGDGVRFRTGPYLRILLVRMGECSIRAALSPLASASRPWPQASRRLTRGRPLTMSSRESVGQARRTSSPHSGRLA